MCKFIKFMVQNGLGSPGPTRKYMRTNPSKKMKIINGWFVNSVPKAMPRRKAEIYRP